MPKSLYIFLAVKFLKTVLPYLEAAAGNTPTSIDDRVIRAVKEIVQLYQDGCFKRLLR